MWHKGRVWEGTWLQRPNGSQWFLVLMLPLFEGLQQHTFPE